MLRGTVGPESPTTAPNQSVLVTISRIVSATAIVAMLK
ncbi:hypothetical protein ACVWYI_003650 [Bradyrhizobium sp. LB13.1]